MVYALKETYEIYQTNGMYMDLFGSWFDQNNSLYDYSSLYLQMFDIFLNKSLPKNVSLEIGELEEKRGIKQKTKSQPLWYSRTNPLNLRSGFFRWTKILRKMWDIHILAIEYGVVNPMPTVLCLLV